MPKSKGIHTCPEKAGVQNMTEENLEKAKAKPSGDESEYLRKIQPIIQKAFLGDRKDYSGKWGEEELSKSLAEFFEFCDEKDLEPSPPLLRLWLGVSKETINEWRRGNRGTFKRDLMDKAYGVMESRYFGKLDKYAVANIFKLKTVHGYVEPQRVEIATTKEVSEADIGEAVSKLGLDK